MKSAFVQLVVLVVALAGSTAGAGELSAARQRVREAKNYYCYYGVDRAGELEKFDVVILHTPAATPELVKRLKSKDVVTIGYITCGEDLPPPRKGDGSGPGGMASWYFDKDNDRKPDMHPIWKSPFANAADPKWREDRIKEARRLMEEVGFDGIFLDTVDDVTIYPETFDGMVELIRDFRMALPNAPIIMNQSWELLLKTAPEIDGLMLEGFSTSYDFDAKSYRRNPPSWDDSGLANVKKYIVPTRAKHPFQVVVLDYARPQQKDLIQAAADRAATFGFLHCAAPVTLDDIYDTGITGRPNQKWWERQTTPESLAYTLDQTRNGFPAGTKILPSSLFPGYGVAAIVDGVEDRSKLHWTVSAWASAEVGEDESLEIRLPQARRGGTLQIDFNDSHASRAFVLQTRASKDSPWQDVRKFDDNRDDIRNTTLPSEPYEAIRVLQHPGGGSALRPNLIWISQLRLIP
jgi:hypothetical protein